MREVIFKAKRLDNGEWIEGYYFRIWDKHYLLWGTTNGVPNMIEIDPNTLSQFTGLLDKNGNKIFEGDIITVGAYSYEEPEQDFTGEVVLGGVSGIGIFALEENRTGTSEDFVELSEIRGSYRTIYEIIGNIHDKESE